MDNAINSVYDKDYEIEYQIQIGSNSFPEYHLRSLSEAYTQPPKMCRGTGK